MSHVALPLVFAHKTDKSLCAGLIKVFQKWWFELEEGTGTLHYYKEEYGKQAGTIPPGGSAHAILSVEAAAGSREISVMCGPSVSLRGAIAQQDQDQVSYQSSGQTRTFLLRARSPEDAQEWADAILRERDSDRGKLSSPNPVPEPEPEPELKPSNPTKPSAADPASKAAYPPSAEEAEPPSAEHQPVLNRTHSKRAKQQGGQAGCLCCGSRPVAKASGA